MDKLNFEELEAKTSTKFVEKIQRSLLDFNGKEMPIKVVKVKEFKSDGAKIDYVRVMLIVGADCHIFYYDKLSRQYSHEIMLTGHVMEFAEMFNDYHNLYIANKTSIFFEHF